jgi:hypothetical protein
VDMRYVNYLQCNGTSCAFTAGAKRRISG